MTRIELTEEEFAQLFKEYPKVYREGNVLCPYCSNPLSPKNLEYWETSTESGTPGSSIEITCDVCEKVIWRGNSWYPGIDNKEELKQVVEEIITKEFE